MKHDQIVEGMARALFVQAWADEEEEKGRTYPGQDLMDVAPKTPIEVFFVAHNLVGRLEQANAAPLATLFLKAMQADGKLPATTWSSDEFMDLYASVGPDFGHYLAMEAVGHGVSWFDDHARFEIEIPHIEFSSLHL